MKNLKIYLFLIAVVIVAFFTSCKKKDIRQQIIGTWVVVSRESIIIESLPTNDKDINWNRIFKLPDTVNNKEEEIYIFTTEIYFVKNKYGLITYENEYYINDIGRITYYEEKWPRDNIGVEYVKIKNEYLLIVDNYFDSDLRKYICIGEKCKQIYE